MRRRGRPEIGDDPRDRIGAVDARVVRRDDEPAAAGERRNPEGQSASSALT